MKMKFFKTAIMSLMLVFGVRAANAQMGQMPSPEEMAKFQADQMKQTVNLNDDQYNKVLVIYKESGEKMRKLFEGGGGQPDFNKMGEIQEEQNKKFKEILTPEQYKKWDEYQQEMRKNMGGFGGGGF